MWDIETKNYCPLETALFCNGVGFVRWSFMTHSGNHPSLMSRHILNQKDCSPWIIESQSTHSLVNHEALKQILLIWCKLVYNSAIFYAKSRRLFFIVPGKKKCNEKRWTLGGKNNTAGEKTVCATWKSRTWCTEHSVPGSLQGFVRTPDPRQDGTIHFQVSDIQVGQKNLRYRSIPHWEREAVAQINLLGVWNIWANIWLQRPLAPESHRLRQLSEEVICETPQRKYERSLCHRERDCCFPKIPICIA